MPPSFVVLTSGSHVHVITCLSSSLPALSTLVLNRRGIVGRFSRNGMAAIRELCTRGSTSAPRYTGSVDGAVVPVADGQVEIAFSPRSAFAENSLQRPCFWLFHE